MSLTPTKPSHGPCAVIIPALNEEASVGRVVAQIRRHHWGEVVVVADGCEDRTAEVAEAAGAISLRLPLRLGAWGAIQTGMRYALANGYDYAITMDADGQHSPSDIHALLHPVVSGGYDVSIGACIKRGSLARKLAWSYLKSISALRLEDITSGFRAYNRSAMELLAGRDATLIDYQDVGVLLLLLDNELKIKEVDVEMAVRSDGHSRIFHSWLAVIYYMYHTSILSLSKSLRGRSKSAG